MSTGSRPVKTVQSKQEKELLDIREQYMIKMILILGMPKRFATRMYTSRWFLSKIALVDKGIFAIREGDIK